MIEVSNIARQLDAHPQLAWDLYRRLRAEWFVGDWRESRFSNSLAKDFRPDGVTCLCRGPAGGSGGSYARVEFIDSESQWRWSASGRHLGDHYSAGTENSLEEAQAAADAVLGSLGARFVSEGK